MWPPVLIPVDPVSDDLLCLLKGPGVLLTDTLHLQASKGVFDDTVLLRSAGRDELLSQPVVQTGLAEPPTLQDQAVVASQVGHLI